MFKGLRIGADYSRNDLADRWGYASYHAIARGVVTPRDSHYIILFVTDEKQASAEPYEDRLEGDVLHWEGPNDHFAEDRMTAVGASADEIHLFHRDRHHSDFTYYGRIIPTDIRRRVGQPSQFVFRLLDL